MLWSHPHPVVKQDGIAITMKPDHPPAFRRVYVAEVGAGFTVKIEMHTFIGSRMNNAEITQPNGKWVLFDVHAVADKIIDRELYPLVQAVVDRVLALDAAYVASAPSEYMDTHGTTWKRVG